ncbi:MAG: PPK2 family polyphosphate kinase [Actinomycetota bacterium]
MIRVGSIVSKRCALVEALIRKYLVPADEPVVLDRWPTGDTLDLDKDAAKAELANIVTRMAFIQHRLMAEAQRSLLVILQGRDASGKDGLIRHVMTGFNPAGVRVTSFKVPSGAERDHDYLWRCHAACPAKGEVGVWNRSHYEDILVPRVKNLVPDEVWKRRYRHIREFERMLTDEGTVVLKFYLHVSHEIQRQRLQKRVDNPESSWKHDPSDISDRSIWHLYEEAYEDVLAQTNRPDAPWFILPGDVKWARDLIFARILLATLESMDPQLPQPDASLRHITVT